MRCQIYQELSIFVFIFVFLLASISVFVFIFVFLLPSISVFAFTHLCCRDAGGGLLCILSADNEAFVKSYLCLFSYIFLHLYLDLYLYYLYLYLLLEMRALGISADNEASVRNYLSPLPLCCLSSPFYATGMQSHSRYWPTLHSTLLSCNVYCVFALVFASVFVNPLVFVFLLLCNKQALVLCHDKNHK